MPNTTTYQELIDDKKEYDENMYHETLQQVTENIAEFTNTQPYMITIIPETKNIHINTETKTPILTTQGIQELTTYLGCDNIIIYQQSNNKIIINYNQENNIPEPQEEYYL